MSVLFIRKHRRFAVCRSARVERQDAGTVQGLLIELSRGGCRVSGLPEGAFAIDESVRLLLDGAEPIASHVRWTSDGRAGLHFAPALSPAMLEALILACRDDSTKRASAKVA